MMLPWCNRFEEIVKSIASIPNSLDLKSYSMQSIACLGKSIAQYYNILFWSFNTVKSISWMVKSISHWRYLKKVVVARHHFIMPLHSSFTLPHGIVSWSVGYPRQRSSLSLYIFEGSNSKIRDKETT